MADNFKVKINANFTSSVSTGSFTWHRLEKILRDAGELRDNEVINGYRIDKQGVNFYLDKRNNP